MFWCCGLSFRGARGGNRPAFAHGLLAQEVVGALQEHLAVFVFGEEARRFIVAQPGVTLVFFGNLNARLARFGKIENDDLEDLILAPEEGELFVFLEVPFYAEFRWAQAGLLLDFAEGGFVTAFFLLDLSLGEVPIVVAMVKQEEFRSLFSAPIDNDACRYFAWHGSSFLKARELTLRL